MTPDLLINPRYQPAAAANHARTPLGLTSDSRILLFGTEGATDPEIYATMVGHQPESRE